jgi:MFS family permease
VDRIAGISALTLAPAIWYFLWAPVVDIGLRRRSWLIVAAALSAGCLLTALLLPLPWRVETFTALLVAGVAVNMLVGAANGGLMASMVGDDHRGRAAGWYQAGNVGGGALGAGATMWLAQRVPVNALAVAVALMVFAPSLAALGIAEPPLERIPARRLLGEMLGELKGMFRSRASLAGLAIFASPMGASAAGNLFSSLGPDYHASERTVILITGLLGGIFTTIGSLAGGRLSDRVPRRLAYAIAAILSAISSAGLAIALNERVFAIGASLYLAAQGVAFAAYAALALELIGPGGRSAATRYTLYNAASNIPIVYMTWIDGQGYKRFGARGLAGADCLPGLVAVCVFLFLIRHSLAKTKTGLVVSSGV